MKNTSMTAHLCICTFPTCDPLKDIHYSQHTPRGIPCTAPRAHCTQLLEHNSQERLQAAPLPNAHKTSCQRSPHYKTSMMMPIYAPNCCGSCSCAALMPTFLIALHPNIRACATKCKNMKGIHCRDSSADRGTWTHSLVPWVWELLVFKGTFHDEMKNALNNG